MWSEYVTQANKTGVPVLNGIKKVDQIIRYCRQAVCKSGCSIHLTKLRRNLFDGNGAGYIAITWRVLPMPNVVLHPGVYLITSHKEVIIRENGNNSGLGDNLWSRIISFNRLIKVFSTPHNSSFARIISRHRRNFVYAIQFKQREVGNTDYLNSVMEHQKGGICAV
ncbi:hypothetical protein Plhal304r1_c051g0133861 [Plasmopara halstedii]